MAGMGRGSATTRLLAVTAVMVCTLLPGGEGIAQTGKVRPAEEAPDQFPAYSYRDDAFYFCTACHSFKVVAAQNMSRARWDESLTWMAKRHNMPDVQGDERRKILDYLEKAFPERRDPRWTNPFQPK